MPGTDPGEDYFNTNKSYAVCDYWFCSAPTQTLPNRAFLTITTSLGRLTDWEPAEPVLSLSK